MAGPNVDFRITGDEKLLQRALARSEREVDKLKGKLRETGQTGKRAGKEMEGGLSKSASMLKGYLVGLASIGGIVATAGNAWRTYLANMREISTETQKATREMLSFIALQEGGTKAKEVREFGAMAAGYGITDRALAYDIGQALQSALGKKAGREAARTVFAASHVGVGLQEGLELEIQAGSQGVAPGEFLRMAYIAGQESKRNPAIIAKAAPALQFYTDKVFAMGAAAVISGPFAQQVTPYTRQGAIALSKTGGSDAWQQKLTELGVGDATRYEKLIALKKAGLDTEEKLALAGLTEMRQSAAVGALVKNIPELDRVMAAIRARNVPGLLVKERAQIEAEEPMYKRVRNIDQLMALYGDATVFGPTAAPAQQLEIDQRTRALAFRRLGHEEAMLGWDLIDAEGRSTRFDEWRFRTSQTVRHGMYPDREAYEGPFPPQWEGHIGPKGKYWMTEEERFDAERDRIRAEITASNEGMQAAAEGLERAAKNLENASNNLNGGTTLGKPDQEPP